MSEPRDQNRFLVRMPEGMRDRIKDAAEASGRSMNAEIVQRLEQSFRLQVRQDFTTLPAGTDLAAMLRLAADEVERRKGED